MISSIRATRKLADRRRVLDRRRVITHNDRDVGPFLMPESFRRSRTVAALACVLVFCLLTHAADAQSSRQTIDSIQPKMVKIFGAGGLKNLYSYGSGFLVSRQGHIATIWNHVLDTDEIVVVLNDGRRLTAKLLGAEPQLDLAVIQIESDDLDLPYCDLSEAAAVPPGTRILAFSNMFKVATGDEAVSVNHGVISARTRLNARRGAYSVPYEGSVYLFDAITNNSGAAGGLVTTRDGRPVGMIGKELRDAQSNTWINYAMPAEALRDTIREIITGDYSSRPSDQAAGENPRRYAPIDFGLVMIPDVVFRTPAFIDAVVAGSQAADAGLKPDDLVMFVNDELIQSSRALKQVLGHIESGDPVRITVRRDAELLTVDFRAEKKAGK